MSTRRLLIALALTAMLWVPSAAFAAPPERTSLPVIERQVMCVTCKIPLNVAQSPQADRERAYIQSLIEQGESEAQIKHALVVQYGSTVLGLPAAHGFDLTVYLVPVAVVAGLVVLMLVLLPRWRRRSREQAEAKQPPQHLAPSDAARLESDLARFDR
jgi:cytochrome c-type biogenesis protein CcmH